MKLCGPLAINIVSKKNTLSSTVPSFTKPDGTEFVCHKGIRCQNTQNHVSCADSGPLSLLVQPTWFFPHLSSQRKLKKQASRSHCQMQLVTNGYYEYHVLPYGSIQQATKDNCHPVRPLKLGEPRSSMNVTLIVQNL